jgi:hypothetical protein
MRRKSGSVKAPVEKAARNIHGATRRRYSAEESEPANAIGPREQANRIVLEGLRGEESIAKFCRREGMYYR